MIVSGRHLRFGSVLMFMLTAGCGQRRFGESVQVMPDRQTRLATGQNQTLLLQLPEDAAFNVTESKRSAEGNATAASSATERGTATCSIEVPPGGSATAEFQLGHVLRNATDAIQSVTIQVELSYLYDGGDDGDSAPKFAALKLFVRDERDRTLRRVRLMTRSDLFGAVRREVREAPVFDLELEAGTAYTVVLAGKLAAEVPESGSAVEARFDVGALAITVRSRS